ncbi:hypothetical protein POTOM_024262 [Populus tomentosa]|uniref:Uncharacterized protein n=1 Tax=Populus tomentosa TaxID=118781 RepID=A0A8X8D076_POPTO|nr:hypothetical protein POTOM_024262 [Populus tomentosa]
MEGLHCSNTVVFEGFSPSLMEALVLETAIAASKALALSLFMNNLFLPTGLLIEQKFVPFFHQMGSLPNGSGVLPEESGTSQELVL